jgi:hypothetical protein
MDSRSIILIESRMRAGVVLVKQPQFVSDQLRVLSKIREAVPVLQRQVNLYTALSPSLCTTLVQVWHGSVWLIGLREVIHSWSTATRHSRSGLHKSVQLPACIHATNKRKKLFDAYNC